MKGNFNNYFSFAYSGPHPQGMEVHFDQGEVTERMENYGLRAHELNEMLSFGIKPWEDNAFETYFSILEQREELARQQQGYQWLGPVLSRVIGASCSVF